MPGVYRTRSQISMVLLFLNVLSQLHRLSTLRTVPLTTWMQLATRPRPTTPPSSWSSATQSSPSETAVSPTPTSMLSKSCKDQPTRTPETPQKHSQRFFFLQYIALDVTPNCTCEIHCLALDGFSLNTFYKLSSKEKKSWRSQHSNPGLLGGQLECFLCAQFSFSFIARTHPQNLRLETSGRLRVIRNTPRKKGHALKKKLAKPLALLFAS